MDSVQDGIVDSISNESEVGDILDSLFPNNKYEKHDKEEFQEECKGYPYTPTILPAKRRVVVIGDLHGDYGLTIQCLKLARVIDENLKWVGGDTVVVQIGDQIDRCRPLDYKCDHPLATVNDEGSDIRILELFTELDRQARISDGLVVSLLGNHELMNADGNLNYVSYRGLEQFKDYKDPKNGTTFESGEEARKFAFAPGNQYGKMLGCTRVSCLIVGSFLFVHAGIVPEFTRRLNIKNRSDLFKINYGVRKWLLGLINKDYIAQIVGSFKYSMFWDRILGGIPPNMNNNDPRCVKFLEPVLKLFKIGKMVIGHTPQFFSNNEGINSTCDQKLWRVDTGGSDAFSKFDKNFAENGSITDLRKPQVLEIIDDSKINILK